jgi:arylsulfatase A-like enzyme
MNKRRDFLKMVGGGLCCVAGGCLLNSSARSVAQPNIVLCMADDQGWGDMAYNGHPVIKTPNFDAMAESGLRFDRFYAAAPVCSPTRGSVMTGRHPNRFGCFSWGHTLRPQEVTLAEALQEAGYVTGHFGKWHLGSVRVGSPVNPGASGFDEWCSAPNFFDNDPLFSREGKAVRVEGESSMVTVDAALDFVERHSKSEQPFLAVVWFGSPHAPHRADPEFGSLYESEKRKDFYGEITGMDAAFGKLRNGLRRLNIQDNTILWYCSDNGGLMKESTGGRARKGSIYEGGLRVPSILEWPARLKKARNTAMPCNTADIYPTLLEITEVDIKDQPQLDGVSLLPLIEGTLDRRPGGMGFWQYPERGISTPSEKWMQELAEAQNSGIELNEPERLRLDAGDLSKQYDVNNISGHAAWLKWPWKLHRIEKKAGAVTLEFYNLAEDSRESENLAQSQSERSQRMLKELEKWQRSVLHSLNGADY